MTGFRGRAGIYEMLTIDESIQAELARPEPSLERIRRKGMKSGMRPLRLAGAQKIAAGITTFEEVLNVAPTITHDPRKSSTAASEAAEKVRSAKPGSANSDESLTTQKNEAHEPT